MSDEQLHQGTEAPDQAGTGGKPAGPNDGGGNTADRTPAVSGGQPAVNDDLPRNTEF